MRGARKLCVAKSVDGAKRITTKILDDFHDASTTKPAQYFCGGMFSASLSDVQGAPDVVLNGIGKLAQIFAARSYPDDRF
jgi:hypothetical protein